MAIENFTEMRDRVADSRFLFRKKVELALEARYPQLFVPKYAMVTFHRIPYSVALSRGKIQDRMLAELCESKDRVEDLDWEKADRLIHRDLSSAGDYVLTDAPLQMDFQAGEDFALAMDERDPLKEFRHRFSFPKSANGGLHLFVRSLAGTSAENCCDLHSSRTLEDWANLGVEGHFQAAEPMDALPQAAHRTNGGTGGSQASRSRGDEFAHRKSSPDDGVVLSSDDAKAQDCRRARSFSLRPVRCEIADSFSWL